MQQILLWQGLPSLIPYGNSRGCQKPSASAGSGSLQFATPVLAGKCYTLGKHPRDGMLITCKLSEARNAGF